MVKIYKVAPTVPMCGPTVTEAESADYKVRLNGQSASVYTCRVSAMPLNREWAGSQRDIRQSELASMIGFSADGAVNVEVECAREFKSAVVRPLSKNIAVAVKGGVVSFALEKPGQYVLELDGSHFALHIFYNRPDGFTGKDDATYYFGPGIHFPGLIRLKSGESVYIDESAVVNGSVFAENAEDIRIFGYGVLDGGYESRIYGHCYDDYTKGNLKFYGCKNVSVNGVVLRDSAIWALNLFGCDGVNIDNVKIVGQWRYNTDGIDIVNSQNVLVKNSFIRAFDDVITLKGIDKYKHTDVKNIRVTDCVLWCGWGRTLEIGFETACREYSGITFENSDLIHNDLVCLDIQNGDYAFVHDVIFRNLRVEYQKDTLAAVYQTDDSVWIDKNAFAVPYLITVINRRFREPQTGHLFPLAGDYGKDVKNAASVRGVLYKDIFVFSDDPAFKPPILVSQRVDGAAFADITIDGLYVNGKRLKDISETAAIIDGGGVKNFTLK
jgi:hypothetical protein